MADWRALALRFFPDMRETIAEPAYSVHRLFFDLLPRVRKAHGESDNAVLKRAYALAAWAVREPPESLWHAGAMAFYEHLVDAPETRGAIPETVPRALFFRLWSLWEARLEEAEIADLKRILAERAQWEPLPQTW